MRSAEAQRHQQKHKYKQKASAKQQLTQKQLQQIEPQRFDQCSCSQDLYQLES